MLKQTPISTPALAVTLLVGFSAWLVGSPVKAAPTNPGQNIARTFAPATTKPAPLYPTFNEDQLQRLHVAISKDLNIALDPKKSVPVRHKAVKSLMQLRLHIGQPRYPRLQAALAQIALSVKNDKIAWQFVRIYAHAHHPYDSALAWGYIAAGRVLLARKLAPQAMNLCNWVAEKDQGINQVRAAEVCGLALQDLLDYRRSIDSFHFALAYTAQNSLNPYGIYNRLMQRIQRELSLVQKLEDIKLYGPDFVLYRQAQRIRLGHGNLKRAYKIYRKVVLRYPHGPYATASRFYSILCIIADAQTSNHIKKWSLTKRLNLLAQAASQLREFYQSKPYGLYRGQALLNLGQLAINNGMHLKAASEWFAQLQAWLLAVQVKKIDWNKRLPPVKTAAVPLTTPPQLPYQQPNFWGTIKASAIKPGQLVNRITCPWYLNHLAESCVEYRGFIAFVQGKNKSAANYYRQILALDPKAARAQSSHQPNIYWRLMFGVQHSYLMAYPGDLNLYAGRLRDLVLLADFYYVTERYPVGETLGREMLSGQFGRLLPVQTDYIHYIFGCCLYRDGWKGGDFGGRSSALDQWGKVLQADHETISMFRAGVAFYNMARRSPDRKIRMEARRIIKQLVASTAQNRYVYTARISWAQHLVAQGRCSAALAILRDIPKSAGPFYNIAQFDLRQFARQLVKQAGSNDGQ